MAELGRVPAVSDEATVDGWTVRVIDMDGHRVDRIRLVPPAEPSAGDDAGEADASAPPGTTEVER
jgi:CBS domain containing-hemolysin-like protein